MFPSGWLPCGFAQVPSGGSMPEMRLHVTSPAPRPVVPTPPQQSVSAWQTSPVMRQPAASWQTLPAPGTGAQTRLQQWVPLVHGSPSSMQPPEPKLASALQVPGLVALAPVQRLEQQDAPVKQRSPVAWQPVGPPALMQVCASEQVSEQQSLSPEQPLPSVTQVAPGIGAQVPAAQLLEQQSPFPRQVLPLGTQPATGQLPCVQVPVQQLSPAPQGAAAPKHSIWSGASAAELIGESGWPPPSPPRLGTELPPHASTPASATAATDLDVKARTEVAMAAADCSVCASSQPDETSCARSRPAYRTVHRASPVVRPYGDAPT